VETIVESSVDMNNATERIAKIAPRDDALLLSGSRACFKTMVRQALLRHRETLFETTANLKRVPYMVYSCSNIIAGIDDARVANDLGVDLNPEVRERGENRKRSEMPKPIVVPVQTHYYQYDQQGIAFNMWYLAFIEDARNSYFQSIGYSLGDLLKSGHDIQMVHVEMDWSAALHYGEQLAIEVSVGHTGTTSFSLMHKVMANAQNQAIVKAVYVIIDAATQTKAELPSGLRDALEGDARSPKWESREHENCIGG
jgi:acyl-CoA thioester hydrolase